MKKMLKTGAVLTLAGAVMTACAPASDVPAPSAKAAPETAVPSTVKPGASVQFSHDFPAPPDATRRGTVDIAVTEEYDDGRLFLSASGSDGLNVYGASRTMSAAMTGTRTHAWSLNYQADHDGVFFINIAARTEREGLEPSMRAYAVRIEIGEGAGAAQKPQNGVVEQLEDGSLAVIMPADEVIE